MKYSIIHLNPDRLDLPLTPLYAGKLSSAVWIIDGVPDDIASLAVVIDRPPDPSTGDTRDPVSVAADANVRAYLSPFCFPDASDTLHYHVIATDAQDNPRWLGSGSLAVLENPANGSSIAPEVIPRDTYIRNPVTGLYHLLTATVNELGEITSHVSEEGIQK